MSTLREIWIEAYRLGYEDRSKERDYDPGNVMPDGLPWHMEITSEPADK